MPYLSKKITAITDDTLLHQIGQTLADYRIEDYLLFWLIIETGAQYTHLLQFKVIDVKNKDIIEVPHKGYNLEKPITRKEIISPFLKEQLSKYIQGKKDDDLVFPKNYSYSMFIGSLRRACKTLNIDTINATHLKKTYYYRQYLKDRDIKKLRRRLCHNSVEETWEFLGIPNLDIEMPGKKMPLLDDIPLNYLLTVKDNVNSSLVMIEEHITSKNKPIAAYHDFAEYLALIDAASVNLKQKMATTYHSDACAKK